MLLAFHKKDEEGKKFIDFCPVNKSKVVDLPFSRFGALIINVIDGDSRTHFVVLSISTVWRGIERNNAFRYRIFHEIEDGENKDRFSLSGYKSICVFREKL